MNKLQELVYTLSTSKIKKITEEIVITEATTLGIDANVAKRVWKNYAQFGVISETFDRRVITGTTPKPTVEEKEYAKNWKRAKFPHKSRKVYFKTAAKIILAVKNTDKKVYEVLDEYKVSRTQYYAWLEELTIKGTLKGKKIFDWTQYAKKDVKEIIQYSKQPEKFIKSDVMYTAQLERLNTVMDSYLK